MVAWHPEPRAPSRYKDGLSRYGIPILKIRRSRDRLIFNIGIPILVRRHLSFETTPWFSVLGWHLTSIGNPTVEIRRPWDPLISRMGIPYTGKMTSLYWTNPQKVISPAIFKKIRIVVSFDQGPGPRLNIKTVLSTYGDFHVKDKTAVRTSYL